MITSKKILTNISRYISLILRHKPETINIVLNEHGWANVDELINGIKKQYNEFDMETLDEIVKTDNKQRYSFNEDKTLIRANQGHSINVDVELKEIEPPKVLFHGTGEKYLGSIEKQGLLSMSRLYVHLSSDINVARTVGKRHCKGDEEPVVLFIDTEQMYRDGYKFYLSKNKVWLTKHVPEKYIKVLESRWVRNY